MFRLVLLLCFCLVASANRVYSKDCDGVESSMCQVNTVEVENCSHAPRFCRVSSYKRYSTTVTFLPNFTASNLMMTTEVEKDGTYVNMRTYKRLCEDYMLFCPLEPQIKQKLQFELSVDDNLSGAYPLRVQFWNTKNATEACCFTFRIKTTGRLQK